MVSVARTHALLAAVLLPCCFVCIAGAAPRGGASSASEDAAVIVGARPVTQVFTAYGHVEPIATVPVTAIAAGVLADMKVVPGSEVKAGEVLATLTGAEIESLLVDKEGAVRSAQGRLDAAGRTLAIERGQLSAQMSTRQAIAAAQSAVAAAQAAFDSAQAQLRAAQGMRMLRAPSAGVVLGINAGDGQRVTAGQIVLTLEATDRLWLAAVYYGADATAIRAGMAGQFQPASGGPPVRVNVAAISAALAADGGESVGLVATNNPHLPAARASAAPWSNGERGTVTLNGPTRMLVAVPTRALILDRARWWVLVRLPNGVHPQAVVPGPARGWDTFIEQGLAPGTQVVVQNAYLEYHRGIAQRYTPPD